MHSIIKHPLIGLAITAIGVVIDNYSLMNETVGAIADALMGFGQIYLIVSFIVILAGIIIRHFGKRAAVKEFLEIKMFLEKGLITQEEYDKKSADIKNKLL